MTRHRTTQTTVLFALAALATALVPAGAALAARGVNDAGNFFTESAAAKNQATGVINDIARRHHNQDVYVETVDKMPAGTSYAAFADQKTRAAAVNGVYVLIVREGGHVHVAADGDAAKL